ncbi:hypothetical protein BDA96_01G040200 [Sorghum bicolor]|uniref:CASP-like protein n=2 Tax=Sorghum bicolor TaxID=4558 RepID=A0A921UX61_SORBI|nr:hypothetical protein BDA96_01G040200 [Sorghum bicolor]KXG37271.1 hypothetical protein SORBI_3001G038700 [Sorghum bicolor]
MSESGKADARPSVAPALVAADGDAGAGPADAGGVRSMMERWKMDGAAARARLLLRALAWLFSLLALVVLASNQHGGSQDFRNYPEYNYCLGISIVAWLYATAQVLRDVHRLSSGRDLIAARKASAVVDFAGDQVGSFGAPCACARASRGSQRSDPTTHGPTWRRRVANRRRLLRSLSVSPFFLMEKLGALVQVVAYFLISAMSASAPVTDYMRQAADNLFTDSAAAAISMAFFAFVAIGLSALVSGYNLSMEVLV